jgi:hypothetical protein
MNDAAVPGGMRYFELLTVEERQAAILRLSQQGLSDHVIATATQLSVELIRQILGGTRFR